MFSISPLTKLFLIITATVPPYIFVVPAVQYETRALVCEVYYTKHEYDSRGCALPEVNAQVAATVASFNFILLFCGAISVIVTTFYIQRFGLRWAFGFSLFFSVILKSVYVAAVYFRGEFGIGLLYAGALTVAIAGVHGLHMLIISMVSMLADEDQRSGALGRLGGVITTIFAVSVSAGGYMYNFNHQLPFVLSVIWLLVAAVVSTASLPDFPNVAQADKKPFDVLKMFKPKEVEREGKTVKDWSLVFLGLGAGLSILATGYGDVELDLVGMNNFAFTPQEMGNLIGWLTISKSIFLMFLFPTISRAIHRFFGSSDPEGQPLLSSEDGAEAATPRQIKSTKADWYILFIQVMLELFAVINLAFSTQKWQLYAFATFIPYAGGTGAIVSAVILHFVPQEKRPEAVGAVMLLQKFMCAGAIFLFGSIFAWLSRLQIPWVIWLANGAVIVLSLTALLFVRMP